MSRFIPLYGADSYGRVVIPPRNEPTIVHACLGPDIHRVPQIWVYNPNDRPISALVGSRLAQPDHKAWHPFNFAVPAHQAPYEPHLVFPHAIILRPGQVLVAQAHYSSGQDLDFLYIMGEVEISE